MYREKVIIQLTFNPGFALTGFRTILPHFQQVNLTWARDPIKNQHLVSGQPQKTRDLDELYTWAAMWSRDTDQRIPCFDRCQLIITWMSNIKEVHDKPGLSTYYFEYGRHVAWLRRRRRCAYAPTSNIAIHDNHEEINAWVSFSFLYENGAPLGGPSGRSSAKNKITRVLSDLGKFNIFLSSPGGGHCIVFLDKTLYSHSASPHPGA